MSVQPSTSKTSSSAPAPSLPPPDPNEESTSDFAKRLASTESAPLLQPPSAANQHTSANLSQLQKYSFGLGHVINDIMGVLWFSYALLFFQVVVDLPPTVAALLFLLGQLTDAVATPFAGIVIDRWGTKKKWHFIGVLIIAIGFPFIFHYWNDRSWLTVFKYAIAIIIFQVGWTLVQIAHLSLIPDMTNFLQERAELTTLRYTIFVCSNIIVYLIAYFILHDRRREDSNIIERWDGWKIEAIAIIAVSLGIMSSSIFQSVLRMPPSSESAASKSNKSLPPLLHQTICTTWEKVRRCCLSPKLQMVAAVHTTSRIFHSLNLVYMPFYINETNVREAGILAMAPFFSFIGSLVSSLIISYTSKVYGNNKTLYATGTIFSLLSCLCIFFNADRSSDPTFIYTASLLYGAGSAMTIVKSLCIAANFIGNDTEDGAFIYGIITFFDKIFNGLIIFVVEYFKCFGFINYHHYYKFVLTVVNGLVTIIGYIFLQSLPSSICYST